MYKTGGDSTDWVESSIATSIIVVRQLGRDVRERVVVLGDVVFLSTGNGTFNTGELGEVCVKILMLELLYRYLPNVNICEARSVFSYNLLPTSDVSVNSALGEHYCKTFSEA